MPITTLKQFILMAVACGEDTQRMYEMFEFECTEELRDLIYSLADEDTPEPCRSAMYNMGFVNY